jgi:uncharacterized protein
LDNTVSPCVRNCCLDDDDICLGCFRSVDEIIQWGAATEQQKQKIMALANARKTEYRRKYRPFTELFGDSNEEQ